MTPNNSIFQFVTTPAPRYMMRLSLVQRLIRSISTPVRRFAEIGPGLGDTALFLAQEFPESRGNLIEFSEDSVEYLRRRTVGSTRLSVASGDFREFPGSEIYDLVVACEVLEHLEDDTSAFRAVNRMLRPGGYFLLSVPAFMRKWQAVDQYAGHFRRYEREELVQQLTASQLQIVKFWCYGFPITQIMALPRELYYKKRLRDQPLSKIDATKRSGIDKSAARKFHRLPAATLMSPFFLLQDLMKNTNIGDGYIVLARK